MKQKELAKRLGLRASQVSKMERDSILPRADFIPRFSEVFGVSADYILTGRSFGQPQRDIRIRERVEALEALPEPQRNHLVEFLDALITAHELIRKREEQPRNRRRGPARARRIVEDR